MTMVIGQSEYGPFVHGLATSERDDIEAANTHITNTKAEANMNMKTVHEGSSSCFDSLSH